MFRKNWQSIWFSFISKERTSQLNAGQKSLVPTDNDKNTVIALREIGEGKISIKTIEESAINKLRKAQSEPTELEDLEREEDERKGRQYYTFGDSWVGLYKTYYNVTPEEVKELSKFWVI